MRLTCPKIGPAQAWLWSLLIDRQARLRFCPSHYGLTGATPFTALVGTSLMTRMDEMLRLLRLNLFGASSWTAKGVVSGANLLVQLGQNRFHVTFIVHRAELLLPIIPVGITLQDFKASSRALQALQLGFSPLGCWNFGLMDWGWRTQVTVVSPSRTWLTMPVLELW